MLETPTPDLRVSCLWEPGEIHWSPNGPTRNCLAKLERMNKALRHQEADRVPISDFFWGSFSSAGAGTGPRAGHRHLQVLRSGLARDRSQHGPPHQTVRDPGGNRRARSSSAPVSRRSSTRSSTDPMPAFLRFETDTIEKMAAFQFDDPWDDRRYLRGGDNQIAGVGDGFARNSPAWIETVKEPHPDFPVYGSVCEGARNALAHHRLGKRACSGSATVSGRARRGSSNASTNSSSDWPRRRSSRRRDCWTAW